jgi:hypothetical protein
MDTNIKIFAVITTGFDRTQVHYITNNYNYTTLNKTQSLSTFIFYV